MKRWSESMLWRGGGVRWGLDVSLVGGDERRRKSESTRRSEIDWILRTGKQFFNQKKKNYHSGKKSYFVNIFYYFLTNKSAFLFTKVQKFQDLNFFLCHNWLLFYFASVLLIIHTIFFKLVNSLHILKNCKCKCNSRDLMSITIQLLVFC